MIDIKPIVKILLLKNYFPRETRQKSDSFPFLQIFFKSVLKEDRLLPAFICTIIIHYFVEVSEKV